MKSILKLNTFQFNKQNLFCFSERISSIKFIGRRNKPFYTNTEAKTNTEIQIPHKEVKKIEIINANNNTSTKTSKESELRMKVNNKLFKNFLSNFNDTKRDVELHTIKFSDTENEQINMGANTEILDWSIIKLPNQNNNSKQ
jgi:hypothetical protein